MIIRNESFSWSDERELNFPRLKQVNDEIEGRYYLIPTENEKDEYKKIKLFSVTTVLGDDPQKKRAIYEWRKRVGEQEANRISKFATGRGTGVHTLLEKYLPQHHRGAQGRADAGRIVRRQPHGRGGGHAGSGSS